MKSIVPLVGIVVCGVLHEPGADPVSLPDAVADVLIAMPPPATPEADTPTDDPTPASGGSPTPAAPDPTPATMARVADDLDTMSDDELTAEAEKEGVSLDGISGASAIAAAIRAHRASQPETPPQP